MFNPWFELLATRPQLLAEHASAWAELLAAESAAALSGLRRRLMFQLAAALAAVLGVTLSAVALMLWAVTPAVQFSPLWPGALLWLVPVLVLVLAAGLWMTARQASDGGNRARLQRLANQWQADLSLMKPAPATP